MTPTARSGPVLAFLGVLVVALGLRAHHLGADSFDCDELYAVRIQGVGPKSVAAVMARDGFHTNHPPLMTVPFLVWNAVVGTSEAAVRSLPLAAGVLAVCAVFALGCALGRPWAGVFAAALLAVNPLHVTYSAEARQYALLTALLAASHWLFVLALQRGTRGLVLAYYLVAAWAALTHYFAVPVLLGHAAFAGWCLLKGGARRAAASRLFLAVGLAGLPYFAWLPVMKFQSRGKWDHLTPLTPGSLTDSLAELFGVGGWGSAIGLALSVGVVALVAFGVFATCSVRVSVTAPAKRLVPPGLGWVVLVVGVMGAAAFAVGFPKFIEPTARQTLSGYGYDAAVVDEEVGLLKQTGLLGAGCVALAGVALLAWRRFEARWNSQATGETSLSAGALLAVLLLVPVGVIALGGLTGIPFHQTRNLLVLLPAACVAIGLGLERLCRTWPGTVVAVGVLLGATFAAGQYHAVSRVVGCDGPQLGIETIDWRGVKAWLAEQPAGDQRVVLVQRPATDPGLYYLAAFNPRRVEADAIPADVPRRVRFVHLVGNTFSSRALERLAELGGPLSRVQCGNGWEVYSR